MLEKIFKRNQCNCPGCQITRSGHGFQPCHQHRNPPDNPRPPPPPPPPKRFIKEGYVEVSFDEHEKQNKAPDPLERIAIALEQIAEELKHQRTRRPPFPP